MTVSGQVIRLGDISIRYVEDGSVSGAASGVFELTVPPGAHVPPPHRHSLNEEVVYVLEGRLRYRVDDEVRDLEAGEHMRTPRMSVHAFSNPHEVTARALVILTPDVGAAYFREVASLLTESRPPDPARMKEVMLRYGLVPSN